MKKLLTLLLLTIACNINAQQSEFVVEHCAGKDTFQSSSGLICSNELRNKWFMMVPTYLTSTLNPIPNGFSVIKLNIGKASNSDRLIIRFSGGKKIILKAYSVVEEYGGITNFYANVSEIYSLKNYPIHSIKYVSVDETSFIYYPKDGEKQFFINAFTNFVVKEVNCPN